MTFLKDYLFALVARTHRYHYGGKEPVQGFDCSGLACEAMMAVGILPFGSELNAQSLYDHFKSLGEPTDPEQFLGSLAFFGSNEKDIHHVGVCLDAQTMIEAGGGHPSTVTDQDAILHHAFVKMRPMRYRKDFFRIMRTR